MSGDKRNDQVIHLQSRVQQCVWQICLSTSAVSRLNKSTNDLIPQWLLDNDEEQEDDYDDDFQLGDIQRTGFLEWVYCGIPQFLQ
jgi:hypothetical protein